MERGVPQQSHLGPLFYTIVKNGMLLILNKATISMYADDSIICVAANTEKKVKCISKFWVTIGVKNKTLISYVS